MFLSTAATQTGPRWECTDGAGGLFGGADESTVEGFELDSARLHRRECGVRYRAAVLGTSLAEVVRAAGGLVFDRVRQG
jgi:hypothetical protein